MPSAVSDWLEEQLEARGIDAVVYTRYVLSLLHSHTVDVIYPDEDLQFSRLKKNCEIESLVDELCEKLKEVNSEPSSPVSHTDSTSTTTAPKESQKHKITPQELAEKYYAAFPPLCPQSPSKLISLLPKWKPAVSPIKKKNVRKQNNRQTTYDNKLHCTGEMIRARNQSKPRFNYLNRNKNVISRRSAERMDNINNWELCALGSNNKKGGSQNMRDVEDTLDQCVEANRDIWTNDDDEMKMYEDLPVDIQELLDSPCPQDDTVEMMNMANMRDDGKRNFIPYGTNITSSIWSNDKDFAYDNKFNASVEGADSESMLDFKFSSITIDNGKRNTPWPSLTPAVENATNSFFENSQGKRSLFLEGFCSLPDDWKSTKEECFENEHLLNQLAVSLMKLNHNKEKSCFTEIIPRPKPVSQSFNPFSRTSSMFSFGSRHAIGFEREKEDLLTSERSHFKPINEKTENRAQGQYADGATFVISNNLDKVDYKRSESGSMLLETEFGQSKKYWEYKLENSTPSPELEFVLKFSICQNDKACQTEELSESDFETVEENDGKRKSETGEDCLEEYPCTCPVFKVNCTGNSVGGCLVHPARPESVLGEMLWKYEAKTCEKCDNNNLTWNADWVKGGQVDSEWDSQSLRNIWNGGEICETCLNLNGGSGRPPPSLQLREDISQDGEQLLSDLSSLQKCYMEELPLAEMSCDVNEMVSVATPKERKRRHSFIAAHMDEAGLDSRGTWSFASRLEEDCLIQMSTLPTLRSVTL